MGTRVAGGLHFSDKSLVGVSRLLEDLQHLLEDKDSADIIFVIGREETHIAAHKLILKARYFVFQLHELNLGSTFVIN